MKRTIRVGLVQQSCTPDLKQNLEKLHRNIASVAQAARPYLLSREKKMDLNITTSISPLGQQGMQGSEPFYRKGIGRVIEEDDDE